MTEVVVLDGKILCHGPWPYGEDLPEGAAFVDVELATTERGSVVLATDYEALRRDAYPAIRDQLDALWHGGEIRDAMAAQIAAVKAKYPKTI